jgi:serine/threonine protein kinase
MLYVIIIICHANVNSLQTSQNDLRSLGILLYQMLCGVHPFPSVKGASIDVDMNEELRFPGKLSIEAVDLMRKLFEQDPDSRLTSIRQILDHPWLAATTSENGTLIYVDCVTIP